MINYFSRKLGTITVMCERADGVEEEVELQIRDGNCICVIIHSFTTPAEKRRDTSNDEWTHQLVTFFADVAHMKRRLKRYGDVLSGIEVKNINLNLYFEKSYTLLRYFTKSGHKVTCYYQVEDRGEEKLETVRD